MVEIMSFEAAIADARARPSKRSVLLGNGFSIDYDPAVFRYESLAEEAALPSLSIGKRELFESIGSTDFEVVIEALRTAARVTRLYGPDPALADTLDADAVVVRNGLADVLAARHPDSSLALQQQEVEHARRFLTHFDQIFTVSYDLLLYWALSRWGGASVVQEDGFGRVAGDRLVWNPERAHRVHYLHGALHLFVVDGDVQKLRYDATGSIVAQIRAELEAGVYPLIVTEGSRAEKEARIDSNEYLSTSLRRFAHLSGSLFIHGLSMSVNDAHIVEQLTSSTCGVTELYVGVHGDPGGAGARSVIERAREIQYRRRQSGSDLVLRFYDAESAHVWRD